MVLRKYSRLPLLFCVFRLLFSLSIFSTFNPSEHHLDSICNQNVSSKLKIEAFFPVSDHDDVINIDLNKNPYKNLAQNLK